MERKSLAPCPNASRRCACHDWVGHDPQSSKQGDPRNSKHAPLRQDERQLTARETKQRRKAYHGCQEGVHIELVRVELHHFLEFCAGRRLLTGPNRLNDGCQLVNGDQARLVLVQRRKGSSKVALLFRSKITYWKTINDENPQPRRGEKAATYPTWFFPIFSGTTT